MRIILHIGLHKTGSTYLQKHVFPLINEQVKNVNVMCKPKLGLNWVNKGEWTQANEHIQCFKKQYCKEGVINLISHECLSQDMMLQNHVTKP